MLNTSIRLLLIWVVFAGVAGPAAACINDSELETHEREFRSQYRGQPSAAPAPASTPTTSPGYRLLIGTGSIMLLGAVALAVTGRRVRN